MNFDALVKGLDELLFEIMSWLVFYPITLWKVIRHPEKMMEYADADQPDEEGEKYTDTLNPPIFLLVTLLIAHGVELELIGEDPLVANNAGLAGLISDDTNLILFRVIVFSVFPVLLGARLVRLQQIGLTRQTLEPPFYAQCYVAALFALATSLASALAQMRWEWAWLIGGAAQAGAFVWFLVVQTDWFARNLGISRWRALGDALIGLAQCLLLLGVLMVVLGVRAL